MGLVYPLIEDDVSKAPSVDIHFKSMAMVKEINKELLIYFLLSEDIQKTEENSCDRYQATHRHTWDHIRYIDERIVLHGNHARERLFADYESFWIIG